MERRTEARGLAILALVAVGICALSCKPAWSPQSDKVAYICGRQENGKNCYAVAIYDLRTKESLFITQEDISGTVPCLIPIEAFWPKRSHQLLYVSAAADEDQAGTVRISAYDLRTKTTSLVREVAVPGVYAASSLCPILLQGRRWLWILGNDVCFRVNLKTGKATPLKQVLPFLGGNRKVSFVRQPDDEITFGRIRTFISLKEVPLFTIRPQENETLVPIAATPHGGARFACIRILGEAKTLRVFNKRGHCTKEVVLPESVGSDDDILPGAEWNSDGSVLWIPVTGEEGAGKRYTGIAEINVADGSVRIIRVNEDNRYGDLGLLQVSLAPNGRCLAASTLSDGEGEVRRQVGLCLVDLTTDERRVTVLLPSGTAAPPQRGEPQ